MTDCLVRGSAWLALGLYATALLAGRRWHLARLLWTAGLLALVVHIAIAFGFVHGWSHAAAAEFADRQTLAVTGIDFRGGLWVNYAFIALWLADAAWWWLAPASYRRRPRGIAWAVQLAFAFLFVNAAVVFARDVSRWVGVAVFAGLAILRIRSPLVERARGAMKG